jgi:branched-chain amino acid transport system substrate-binding protein
MTQIMRHIGRPSAHLLVLVGALLAGAWPAVAQTPGVTATDIKIGNINPYSGPASAYGTIGKVIGAYFKKVSDEGALGGRKITYITYDDAYSPPKAVEMARRLVEQDQVALIFQPLGTPSNTAIEKYMNTKKVPQLFVSTGATKFGDYKNFPWTMGFNPSYQTEAKIYAQYIMKNVPDAKIGILFQNDDFGKDYLTGLKAGLGDAAKKMIVLEQSYEVTDPVVDSQVVNLKNSGANVFVNITTPKAAVQAIKKSHDIGWKPLHILTTVSTSVATVLKPAGFDAAKNIVTALYMKDSTDPQWKNDAAMKEWFEFMKKHYPEGNTEDGANIYGVLATQTMVHVLKQAGNDLSRENVMKQAANIKDLSLGLFLPGIQINTSPTDYYPIEQMQLAKFDGERWALFGEVFDARKK